MAKGKPEVAAEKRKKEWPVKVKKRYEAIKERLQRTESGKKYVKKQKPYTAKGTAARIAFGLAKKESNMTIGDYINEKLGIKKAAREPIGFSSAGGGFEAVPMPKPGLPMTGFQARKLIGDPAAKRIYLGQVGSPSAASRSTPLGTAAKELKHSAKVTRKAIRDVTGVSAAAKDIEKLKKIKGHVDKYAPWLGIAALGGIGYMTIKDQMKEKKERDRYRYASVKASDVLEKLGAQADLVDVAKSLEDLSEASSRETLLGFWDRLGRAAMSAQIYAQPEVRRQMMLERGATGGVLGGALGALVGGGIGMATEHGGMRGALEGAAAGTIAGGGLGAYLARRKSIQARRLLENPAAKQALIEKLYGTGGAATQLI